MIEPISMYMTYKCLSQDILPTQIRFWFCITTQQRNRSFSVNNYSIDKNCILRNICSKGFDPYITVADDVSPLYLLTLFRGVKNLFYEEDDIITLSFPCFVILWYMKKYAIDQSWIKCLGILYIGFKQLVQRSRTVTENWWF